MHSLCTQYETSPRWRNASWLNIERLVLQHRDHWMKNSNFKTTRPPKWWGMPKIEFKTTDIFQLIKLALQKLTNYANVFLFVDFASCADWAERNKQMTDQFVKNFSSSSNSIRKERYRKYCPQTQVLATQMGGSMD